MLIPKSIFKGHDSNGKSFRVSEWGGQTMLTFEVFTRLIPLLVIGLISASIFGVLLTVFSIISYKTIGKILHVISGICCLLFIYDCSHFWLMSQAINIIFNETGVNILLTINLITLGLNIVIILFGNLIFNIITFEKHKHSTEVWNRLNKTKRDIIEQGIILKFFVFFTIVTLVSSIISVKYVNIHFEKGWCQREIQKNLYETTE